jgi:glycosyltransferase involved in cell wall biosynthesis
MPEPTVSVVLPVRDGERFLREAVDSVLAQTFRNLELVAVDDASSDSTPAILASYEDPRVRVVAGPGTGIVGALQAGVAAARARYIARMDADDVSLPERLERAVALLDARPRTALVTSWAETIDEEGRSTDVVVLPDRSADLLRILLLRNPIAHGSVVLRRVALDAVGGYREEYGNNEDYDLWRRLLRDWEAAVVPEVLYRYREHGAAVSRASAPQRIPLRERLRDELWEEHGQGLGFLDTLRAGRRYRGDERLYEAYVLDQWALARESLRRGLRLQGLRLAAAAAVLRPSDLVRRPRHRGTRAPRARR